MIAKVLRGTNAGRLLYYLYEPGKANEHTDPHLVAGFGDPAELEPERRPGRSHNVRRLAGLLAQPLVALAGPGYDKPVWHCSVRAAPDDWMLSDAEWGRLAAGIMDRTGLAPAGDDLGVRCPATAGDPAPGGAGYALAASAPRNLWSSPLVVRAVRSAAGGGRVVLAHGAVPLTLAQTTFPCHPFGT